jgi:uncharacterized protein (TIGR02001 family)
MKKVLVMLSVCALISPLHVNAATGKKAKHKKHHPATYQQAKAEPIAMKDVAPVMKDVPPVEEKSWVDNLSGNLAWVSNYMFRGISQTRNLPAVQGSLTYSFPYGIYANAWGSNVRFVDSPATVEMDTILGVRNTIGENFTYDISGARYNYPGAKDLNYNELNTVFNYYFLQAGYSYSANEYNSHTTGQYYQGGINYEIPSNYVFGLNGVNILALFGHFSLKQPAGNSYNDYNVMLSKKIKSYTFAAQWTSTNGRAKNSPYDGSTLIGQVIANF